MNKQSGFTLIEVLSVLGLLAVVALGSSALMVTQTKQVKKVDQSTSVNDFKSEVIAAQQVAATCQANLDSIANPLLVFDSTAANPQISVTRLKIGPDPSAAVIAEVNQEINGSGVAVDRITLGNLRDLGGNRWSGVWTIRLRQIDTSAPSFKEITFSPKVFMVNAATPNAVVITSCVVASLAAAVVPSWSTNGNSPNPNPMITTYNNYFLGTTTDVDIVIRRNGSLVGLINRSRFRTQMGVNSLNEASTADYLTAFGFGALSANTTGTYNVAFGSETLLTSTTSNNETAIGRGALRSLVPGWWSAADDNTAVGANAMTSGGYYSNVAVGANALDASTWAQRSVAVGYDASSAEVGSAGNTSFGMGALRLNNGGDQNVAVGWSALQNNTTGNDNTAVGSTSLGANQTGSSNTAIGGAMADSLNTMRNTAAGAAALHWSRGDYNSALGVVCLNQTTTGTENTGAGARALFANTTGSNNIAVGALAGENANASSLTAIGYRACANAGGVTNSTCIGANSSVPDSNTIQLGDPSVTRVEGAVAFSATSDARLKENIEDYPHGLDLILKLRPVSYNFISDSEKNLRSGFLAQEVESISIPFYGLKKPANDKDFYALGYAEFVVPLVNAVQELYAEIVALRDEVNEHEEEIAKLEAAIKNQNVRFKRLRAPKQCILK